MKIAIASFAWRHRTFVVLFVLLALAMTEPLSAAVWDEPWHREVVAKSDSFGLLQVVKASPQRASFKRIRRLAGNDTGDSIEVDGFYGGAIPLPEGNRFFDDEWVLHFRTGESYYLFLQKTASGTT